MILIYHDLQNICWLINWLILNLNDVISSSKVRNYIPEILSGSNIIKRVLKACIYTICTLSPGPSASMSRPSTMPTPTRLYTLFSPSLGMMRITKWSCLLGRSVAFSFPTITHLKPSGWSDCKDVSYICWLLEQSNINDDRRNLPARTKSFRAVALEHGVRGTEELLINDYMRN